MKFQKFRVIEKFGCKVYGLWRFNATFNNISGKRINISFVKLVFESL